MMNNHLQYTFVHEIHGTVYLFPNKLELVLTNVKAMISLYIEQKGIDFFTVAILFFFLEIYH